MNSKRLKMVLMVVLFDGDRGTSNTSYYSLVILYMSALFSSSGDATTTAAVASKEEAEAAIAYDYTRSHAFTLLRGLGVSIEALTLGRMFKSMSS